LGEMRSALRTAGGQSSLGFRSVFPFGPGVSRLGVDCRVLFGNVGVLLATGVACYGADIRSLLIYIVLLLPRTLRRGILRFEDPPFQRI